MIVDKQLIPRRLSFTLYKAEVLRPNLWGSKKNSIHVLKPTYRIMWYPGRGGHSLAALIPGSDNGAPRTLSALPDVGEPLLTISSTCPAHRIPDSYNTNHRDCMKTAFMKAGTRSSLPAPSSPL